jgi:hypothetical protein
LPSSPSATQAAPACQALALFIFRIHPFPIFAIYSLDIRPLPQALVLFILIVALIDAFKRTMLLRDVEVRIVVVIKVKPIIVGSDLRLQRHAFSPRNSC